MSIVRSHASTGSASNSASTTGQISCARGPRLSWKVRVVTTAPYAWKTWPTQTPRCGGQPDAARVPACAAAVIELEARGGWSKRHAKCGSRRYARVRSAELGKRGQIVNARSPLSAESSALGSRLKVGRGLRRPPARPCPATAARYRIAFPLRPALAVRSLPLHARLGRRRWVAGGRAADARLGVCARARRA